VGVTLVVAQFGERGVPPAAFTLVAVLLLASFLVTVIGVREPVRPLERQGAGGLRVSLASLLECRAAMCFFVGLFALCLGLNAVVPFLMLYATREIGASEDDALRLFVVLIAVAGALAMPCGRLADRGTLTLPGTGGQAKLRVGPAPEHRRPLGSGIVCLPSHRYSAPWRLTCPSS
jgi:hypothetical protein